MHSENKGVLVLITLGSNLDRERKLPQALALLRRTPRLRIRAPRGFKSHAPGYRGQVGPGAGGR
jgi:hypothetical protein